MFAKANKCVTMGRWGTSAKDNGVSLISRKPAAVALLAPILLLMQGLLFAQGSSDAAAAQPAPVAAPAVAPAAPAQNVVPPAHAILPGDPGSTQDKRIAGILPNYRTADNTTPFAPLTVGQKWKIATKDTFDYPSYVLAAAFAGLSQLDNSNPEYGQGLKGYAKRYAAGIADQDLGNFMTEAIYPTLLHEDPRYFRKVNGSVKGRLWWAIERIVVTKNDSGRSEFNFSEWLGNGTVAALGNLYYPNERGFGSTMQRTLTQVGTDTISDVLKEFWPDIKKKLVHKQASPNAD
jgi:hypothetical protein